MKTQQSVLIESLRENPNNPRFIRNDKFEKLVKSLREFPEMLVLRPIVVNKEMVVLGGNMRLKAAKEIGMEKVPIIVADLTPEQEREFTIKDNASFGDWDWDAIANEWSDLQLTEWGLEVNFPIEETEEPSSGLKNDPKSTDDEYSVFECIMQHQNKLNLIEAINKAKKDHQLETNEEALTQIANYFLNR